MDANAQIRLQDVSDRLRARLTRGEWRDTPCLNCSKALASGDHPHAACYKAWDHHGLGPYGTCLADCFDCYTKGLQCTALTGSAVEDVRTLRQAMRWGDFVHGDPDMKKLKKAAQDAIDSHESAQRISIENSRNTFTWGDMAPSPAGSVIRSRASSPGSFRWGEAIDNDKPAQRAWIGGMPNADYTPSTSSASVRPAGENVSNGSYKAPVAKSVDNDESAEEKPAPRDWGTYSPSSYAASNNSVHSTVPHSLRSAINFASWGFPVARIKNKVDHPAAACDLEQSLANTDVDMDEHDRLIKENIRLIDDYKRLVEDHQQKADENKRVVDDYKRLTEEVKQMAKNYERMASDFRSMASDFQLMAMNYSSMMEEKSAAAKEKKIRNDQIMALLE